MWLKMNLRILTKDVESGYFISANSIVPRLLHMYMTGFDSYNM